MILLNKNNFGIFFIKQGILFFWFCWFFIACLTNITDLSIAKNWISMTTFHSGNYSALEKVINIYHIPNTILDLLFSLDIFAQGLAAILFFVASFCFWFENKYTWPTINMAFGISLFLWSVFLIMEEIFIAYSYESTHSGLFMFELISLLTIHLIPHKTSRYTNFNR